MRHQIGWEEQPHRWLSKDGQHYYLVPLDFGWKSIERIHKVIKKEERLQYLKQWRKLSKEAS